MIKKILSFLFVLLSVFAKAEETTSPQMADAFRENGKIYVVITVIGIIFFAIVLFLIYIERKLKKLEDDTRNFKANN